jgi:hypothetical protein
MGSNNTMWVKEPSSHPAVAQHNAGNWHAGVAFIQRAASKRRQMAQTKIRTLQLELGLIQPVRLVTP